MIVSLSTPRQEIGEYDPSLPSIFLAGTIDMNNSINWQEEVISWLNQQDKKVNVFNPRRKGFPEFDEEEQTFQIEWELKRLLNADFVLMNFADDSKSPVSMLELGVLLASHRPVYVACSPRFYRFLNVKLTCAQFFKRPKPSLREAYDLMMQYVPPCDWGTKGWNIGKGDDK